MYYAIYNTYINGPWSRKKKYINGLIKFLFVMVSMVLIEYVVAIIIILHLLMAYFHG